MKTESEKLKIRSRVEWNKGQRIHLTKEGKGSYKRKEGKKSY